MSIHHCRLAFRAAIVAVGLSAASANAIETPESRAQGYIDQARSTINASNARLISKAIACDSSDASAGELEIARVDGLMQGLINIQSRFPSYMQAGVVRAITTLGTESGRLRLELADGYLAAHCAPQADRLYRFVLANFTSGTFDALRQRALVGIEDAKAGGR